jgi:Holliday junction DNA helicase RuvA
MPSPFGTIFEMIYSLNGHIEKKLPPHLVVNVNGVGYFVQCPLQLINSLKENDAIKLVIYHHFRDDAQQLFGFETVKERELFELLISVSGIGPKVALGILSSVKISDLISAIQSDNIMLITQCPGVGKKTAERLVIELKDKVKGVVMGAPTVVSPTASLPAHDSDDIVMALRQLGYQKDEIRRGFMKHAKELSTVESIEDQIKILLKYL